MVSYDDLRPDIESMPTGATNWQGILARLVGRWADDYALSARNSEMVETQATGFSYLFDIASTRLIAAWGVSQGRHRGERDASRMAGHPLSAGPLYHRGHSIPHRLGGGTDINLVPQLGNINIGAFRTLENQAVANPGALYFSYWRYARNWRRPFAVDQGLLIAGMAPKITHHGN